MKIIQAIGIVILISLALFDMAVLVVAITSKHTTFTDDYIKETKYDLEIKILAFKDSSMKHVNEPKEYNRYVDSANKYIDIHRYLK